MTFRFVLACLVGALAAPAAQASSPIPSLEDVLRQLDRGVSVADWCVYEIDRYGNRRPIACAPGGSLPAVVIDHPRP